MSQLVGTQVRGAHVVVVVEVGLNDAVAKGCAHASDPRNADGVAVEVLGGEELGDVPRDVRMLCFPFMKFTRMSSTFSTVVGRVKGSGIFLMLKTSIEC